MKTDSTLRHDVEQELAWDPAVTDTRIGVEVEEGVVTLAGHVDSHAEKVAAEKAALRVAGVKGVTVEITVNPPGSMRQTDVDLARAAHNALSWDTTVPRDAVHVLVEDGVVTLSGEVSHAFQRESAEHALLNLMGMREIHNEILLKPSVAPRDVKVQIEAALQRQAHLDAQGVQIAVQNDEITVEGEVHSWSERRVILNAAWAAPGVTRVVDKLRVSP